MKLLTLDLETAPNLGHVWKLFKQTISISQLMESGYVLCWAAKWYDDSRMFFASVQHQKAKAMLKPLWTLLDEADAICTFNGKHFDVPTANKEFLLNDFAPPSSYQHIDLYQVFSKRFLFPSNKLDYAVKVLGIGAKIKHEGHELWVRCMNRDPEAWAKMQEYNEEDVRLTEALYERLMPWIPGHPNIGLYEDDEIPRCTNCGSTNLRNKGYYYTNVSKFRRFKCKMCGAYMRSRFREKTSKELLRGID